MTGLDLAWCFLIVFAVYVLVAGLLAWSAFADQAGQAPGEGHPPGQGSRSLLKRG